MPYGRKCDLAENACDPHHPVDDSAQQASHYLPSASPYTGQDLKSRPYHAPTGGIVVPIILTRGYQSSMHISSDRYLDRIMWEEFGETLHGTDMAIQIEDQIYFDVLPLSMSILR
jgi:hypothetical protein